MILNETLQDILHFKSIDGLRIEDFQVAAPFATVLLNDGSIGSAGNYDVQNHSPGYNPNDFKKNLQQYLSSDPLLLQTLKGQRSFAALALYVSVLSALSQSLLQPNILSECGLLISDTTNDLSAIRGHSQAGDTVTLVGFGGGLDIFVRIPYIKHIYVCDFMFHEEKYRLLAEHRIQKIRGNLQKISLVTDVEYPDVVSKSSICCITGSALCNGSIEDLLTRCVHCHTVIVQGPSSSIFPASLFRRGVTLLLTTRKTRREHDAARSGGNQIYQFVDQNYVAITKYNTNF